MKTLKDKAIVITGAGGVVAGDVAESLAEAGARPILVDRDRVRIEGRAASFGTIVIEEDLMSEASAHRAADAAHARMGRIDGVVHLIGAIVPGRLEEVDDAAFDEAFDSNVRTLFHVTRAFLPHLRAQEEAWFASIGAKEAFQGGSPGAALFAAAKGAAATMLRSLDAELAGTGVDVTIVSPLGPIDTGSARRHLTEHDQAWITPQAVARAFRAAALAGEGGRLLELPIHPPR
ncbi:MAG: SDR family oxidoreductase [Trueperaceae bacterium]